ncbi:MAG: hypothetical protein BWY25_03265 [Chloroflexi bacterium ADurb.Bin222]|nr:MAG: hypothetical protein BWY25_03265 [Chloroflexi bacterium ADurb.Bin222]
MELARLYSLRLWAYRAAEAAAVTGAALGRDYAAYIAGGEISLDEVAAFAAAEATLRQELDAKGVSALASYDIRVHADNKPGLYPGFPPISHAGMLPGDWAPSAPSVGVYLELRITPVMYGWINGNAPIPLRVFAAASVVTP